MRVFISVGHFCKVGQISALGSVGKTGFGKRYDSQRIVEKRISICKSGINETFYSV